MIGVLSKRVLTCCAAAMLSGCAGVGLPPSVWPPKNFRLVVDEVQRDGRSAHVIRRLQVVADGTVIYEAMMQPGDSWVAPQTEEPPLLRSGESGAIYFEVANKFYGPVGEPGSVTKNLPLTIAGLQETFPQVNSAQDKDLMRYAEAQGLSLGTGGN